MNIAGVIYDDLAAAPGISTTVFVQGCERHCPGCHNPESWDFDGGEYGTVDKVNEIIESLDKNNIKRNLCIMGGEPMHPRNLILTQSLVIMAKKLKDANVYIWTGYTYEELLSETKCSSLIKDVLQYTDYIVDGPYIESLRDTTIPLRGSTNQRIINVRTGKEVTEL